MTKPNLGLDTSRSSGNNCAQELNSLHLSEKVSLTQFIDYSYSLRNLSYNISIKQSLKKFYSKPSIN